MKLERPIQPTAFAFWQNLRYTVRKNYFRIAWKVETLFGNP